MGGLRHIRALVFWAMLSPFLLLSLIPAGVMPAKAADGTMLLILCTPEGVVEQRVDLNTGKPVPDHGAGSDQCHWAMAQVTPDLAPTLALPTPPATATLAEAPAPTQALHLSHAKGLPPATGPPPAL